MRFQRLPNLPSLRDSYDNPIPGSHFESTSLVMFHGILSLPRFKEITGQYPTKITVVGFDFKETRFHDLHRAAIRFPADDFHYIGKRPGGRFDHTEAEEGERKSALEPYKEDPYGCLPNGALLTKRVERNPFHRTPPYGLSCPEMQGLLDWCEPEVFHGDLPWSPMKTEDGS